MFPLVAVVGALAVLGFAFWPSTANASPAPPPEPKPEGPAEPKPEGPAEPVPAPGSDLVRKMASDFGGAAAGAAAAAGAMVAKVMVDFIDPTAGKQAPISYAAAPLIGGVVAGGLVLAAGPQAIIVIPALVIIAAANDIFRAVETHLRWAEQSELMKKRDELKRAGDYFGAWACVEKAKERGFSGFEWVGMLDVPEFLPLKEPMADLTGARVSALKTKEQLRWGYSTAPDKAGDPLLTKEQAQARGDKWADGLGADIPWLRQYNNRDEPGSFRSWATYEGLRTKPPTVYHEPAERLDEWDAPVFEPAPKPSPPKPAYDMESAGTVARESPPPVPAPPPPPPVAYDMESAGTVARESPPPVPAPPPVKRSTTPAPVKSAAAARKVQDTQELNSRMR